MTGLSQATPTVNHDHADVLIMSFDAAAATPETVGGKGASLARLAAADLPVPSGFYVTTAAYWRFVTEQALQPQILAAVAAVDAAQPATLEAAAEQIRTLFGRATMSDDIAAAIRAAYAALGEDDLAVAVRSSATAEDLPDMSFAGQQDTYLNMRGAAMVLDAVKRCWASLWTARAIGYRLRNGIAAEDVSLAVVVQELVPADAAGIMFTAHPVTGARDELVINATWGLGEAIVGGQVNPDTMVVDRASGAIKQQQIGVKDVMTVRTADGTREEATPLERRERAVLDAAEVAELARLGTRIEALYGQPMDIEWALHAGRFFIVQARPITTLPTAGVIPEIWNDSLVWDGLWTSSNVGEAVPDVMTPCTWSLMQMFIDDTVPMRTMTGISAVGNIGGRLYMNISLLMTMIASIGFSQKFFLALSGEAFGRIPKGLKVPIIPLSRLELLRRLVPGAVQLRRRVKANQQRLPAFLAAAPARCDTLHARIAATTTSADLIALWHVEVLPYFRECSFMLEAGARRDGGALVRTRRRLMKVMGEADANTLLSGLNAGDSQLASLGPVLGLDQLARGTIDRATYARQWGHRSPHEFEVSRPRPAEEPEWIDQQLDGLRKAPVDVQSLLDRQRDAQAAAWTRFQEHAPRQVARVQQRLVQIAAAYRDREAARSEVIRVFWVLRAFVLRAGALTGQGDAIFYLGIEEILALLGGDTAALAAIPARQAAFERYSALPPYPGLIVGPFDPFRWAADPERRNDVFDAHSPQLPVEQTVTGFPGAAGIVEGSVRVLTSADDGDQLQAGEVLVTTVTNVGWTPLFPRAAAVVTDVGAPLSHAAIVARELGIPAVVGCGNATMRLHTGDRVRVDGGLGTVEVLGSA